MNAAGGSANPKAQAMRLSNAQKLDILRSNRNAIAVYQQPQGYGDAITVAVNGNSNVEALNLPPEIPLDTVVIRVQRRLRSLELPVSRSDNICYNEPVPGGVQIQPRGAPWVGTLGAAVNFTTRDGLQRWGILSNWHVMCPDNPKRGDPIHQPLDDRPAIALLEDWEPINPSKVNLFDAAVADAKIDGLHTVGPDVHCLGKIDPAVQAPNVNLPVAKCGRTTGLTTGICVATDAALKVGYQEFEAMYIGQAVFAGTDGGFSAPGDSGSLIVHQDSHRPIALLFAGNDQMTIGSPLLPIQNRFGLSFQFPE